MTDLLIIAGLVLAIGFAIYKYSAIKKNGTNSNNGAGGGSKREL